MQMSAKDDGCTESHWQSHCATLARGGMHLHMQVLALCQAAQSMSTDAEETSGLTSPSQCADRKANPSRNYTKNLWHDLGFGQQGKGACLREIPLVGLHNNEDLRHPSPNQAVTCLWLPHTVWSFAAASARSRVSISEPQDQAERQGAPPKYRPGGPLWR
jgi:hypothetical protein